MKQTRWYQDIAGNSPWFGLAMGPGRMTPTVLPLLMQQPVAEAQENISYADLRFLG